MSRSKRHDSTDDRISALPDELLHHIMSFLTPRETVQTCVLSRRWQTTWVSARCLIIDSDQFCILWELKTFLDNLLLDRGCTSLDKFWLRIIFGNVYPDNVMDYCQIRPWVCHALRCNTQVLGIVHDGELLTISNAFTSSNLKRLHLCKFEVDDWFVEKLFSGCPKLEELELICCFVNIVMLSSAKLKRLTVTTSDDRSVACLGYEDLVIDMPNLVSLDIKEIPDRNPYFLNLSSLDTASVCLTTVSFKDSDVDCNVLSALSNATSLRSLSLTVNDEEAIKVVGRDALRCGTFSNLKTLSLGEWCLGSGCRVLLHLLQRSPKIQKLILHLTDVGASQSDQQHAAAVTDPDCNQTETPFNCENLKKIEINCPQGDKRIHVIVRILFENITSPTEINITSH
ncbi:putative F-box/LRR-repeat protein At3g59170 [Lolium rigidum]|uniref:putative F-box/LRR-repeat protein At3g59170 n=1 Tax=Lolium rigidum TaxID=89674 RepID=UPI001F5E0E21|nr:putative F-box/LRR-repeat protein At3g59170 [Lolium rigidum]XP_047073439.1 putative F-box/LRR-repeat protein At3g59170 [Lolium rigidum]